MDIIIDRVEGDFAVVETPDGNFYNIPKILLPDCREGDVYTIKKDDSKKGILKNEIKDLMNDLFR